MGSADEVVVDTRAVWPAGLVRTNGLTELRQGRYAMRTDSFRCGVLAEREPDRRARRERTRESVAGAELAARVAAPAE